MISAGLTGFFTSLSLILAIGAQNSMLLRQGLAGHHVFWACVFCSVSDSILIVLGVAGFNLAIEQYPLLPLILTIGGIVFLIIYGSRRLWTAYKGHYTAELSGEPKSFIALFASLFIVTWLNPHVYLDTLILLGSISVQYNNISEKIIFGASAVSASFIFFFCLGYGARILAPYFQSVNFWKVLDIVIAFIMYLIAIGLIKSL
jgi:L-lysine exporter family protein LysE/ArgO